MFKHQHKRYKTKGIEESIPLSLQYQLWKYIDQKNARKEELDYLQVFELSEQDGKQIIVHRQEIPPTNQQYEWVMPENKNVTATVWVIDDGVYQTMLLPEEY